MVGIFIVFFSIGIPWVQYSGSENAAFNSLELIGAVESAVGPCHCTPSNDTATGAALAMFLPYLIPSGFLSIGLFLVPVAVIVSLFSFLRMRLVLPAGLLAVLDGSYWIGGMAIIGRDIPVAASLGPYTLVVGGFVLLLVYALDKFEKLEPSDDFT